MLAISKLIPTDTGPSAKKKKRKSQNVAYNSLILSIHKNCLQNLSIFFPKCLEAILNIPWTQIMQEFSYS